MKIDLELFRTFKAVFEIGTISGAARVLEVTQPSVTGHLKALEAYAGHPLFERSTRNMKPTLYAKQLYNKVASSLTQLEVAEDFAEEMQPVEVCYLVCRHLSRTVQAASCS